MRISDKWYQQEQQREKSKESWLQIEYQQLLSGLWNLTKQRAAWQFFLFTIAGILVYQLPGILEEISKTFKIGIPQNPSGELGFTNIPKLKILLFLILITSLVAIIAYITDLLLAEKQDKLEMRIIGIEKEHMSKTFPTGFSGALQGKVVKGVTLRFLSITRGVILVIYFCILVLFFVSASRHFDEGVTKAPKGVTLKKGVLNVVPPKTDAQTQQELEDWLFNKEE